MACAALTGAAQALPDSVAAVADSLAAGSRLLGPVEVTVERRRPAMEITGKAGAVTLGAEAMAAMPQFMGNADPLRLMQSLPAVTSSDVVSGGIYIQGSENAHNRVAIDGAEVYNPMHLLGLFSVFNTPHFERFDIDATLPVLDAGNYIGADIEAVTSWQHPRRATGSGSVGLIEAHATARVPAGERTSLSLSGRATYLNLLYGNAIKIENAPLHYGFRDLNATLLQSLGCGWKMKLGAYYGSDRMHLPDPNYSSDIRLGWTNAAASAAFRQADRQSHTLAFSHLSNSFRITFNDIDSQLPSSLWSLAYAGSGRLGRFRLAGGAVARSVVPQQPSGSDGRRRDTGLEAWAAAELPLAFNDRFSALPALKGAYYRCGGFGRAYPLPSLSVTWRLSPALAVTLGGALKAQFTHKIEESTIGLPTDFWLAANATERPLTAREVKLSLQGKLFGNRAGYLLTAYYRSMGGMTDWTGTLFDMLNEGFDPLSAVVTGRGRAAGVAAMVQGRVGRVQGWVSYTLSRTRQRFDGPGAPDGWYPAVHDRTHDFNVALSWRILPSLTASATFVYATGLPYTEALYGYMIGENLIGEFGPHNGARLPAMHRLDLGLDWRFSSGRAVEQGLNASLFNVYGHDNVLVRSFKYNQAQGLHSTQWTLGYVLPSVSYYIKF